jgi:prepilin-type N-terminal cleavage/methylation domain-containing protein
MKKNKGYTLIELLVAVALLMIVMAEVGVLMINSQNLYRHGFYEVSLQEESQMVLQQIEDLMMSAAVNVDYNTIKHNGIDSDVITIVTAQPKLSGTGVPTGDYDEVTYKIGLAFDVNNSGKYPSGDPVRSDSDYGTDTHKFESLIISKKVGTGSETYATMAEGVKSLRVYVVDSGTTGTKDPMQNYKEGDYVTLYLEMQNEQYYYKTDTSAQSIYLRNMPGSGGVPKPTVSPVSGGANNDKVVNVLREHTFNLKDYVGDAYKEFKWKETNGSTAKYTLTADGHLSCVDSLNNDWDDKVELGKCVILATQNPGDYTDAVEIQMYTEKVSFKNMPLYIYDNMTAASTSVFPVTGICVHCIKKHNIVPVLVLEKNPFSSDAFKLTDWGCEEAVDFNTPSTKYEQIIWKGLDPSITAANIADSSMDTGTIPAGTILHYYTYSLNPGGTRLPAGGISSDYTPLESNKELLNLGGAADFSYGILSTHDANCICMHVKDPMSTSPINYWNWIVDKGNGFIALRFKLQWDSGWSPEFFGYLYPQQTGTAAQHDKIMKRIATVYSGGEGTEYNFVVTTPTAYPTPELGASGAAAGAVLESTGVTLTSATEGTITIKNTGTADSGTSWTFTADAGVELGSVTCSTSGYSMSFSGKVLKVTGTTNIAAGAQADLAFTYGTAAALSAGTVAFTSDTAGKVTVSNTGGSASGGNWSVTVDTGKNLQSVTPSDTSKYAITCSGTTIKITGYNAMAAGTSEEITFTYTTPPEPLVIPAGGYTLSGRNAWADNAQYNVALTNTTSKKVSSITVTMHVASGTVTTISGAFSGTVSGEYITVTTNNYGNGFEPGASATLQISVQGSGDINLE